MQIRISTLATLRARPPFLRVGVGVFLLPARRRRDGDRGIHLERQKPRRTPNQQTKRERLQPKRQRELTQNLRAHPHVLEPVQLQHRVAVLEAPRGGVAREGHRTVIELVHAQRAEGIVDKVNEFHPPGALRYRVHVEVDAAEQREHGDRRRAERERGTDGQPGRHDHPDRLRGEAVRQDDRDEDGEARERGIEPDDPVHEHAEHEPREQPRQLRDELRDVVRARGVRPGRSLADDDVLLRGEQIDRGQRGGIRQIQRDEEEAPEAVLHPLLIVRDVPEQRGEQKRVDDIQEDGHADADGVASLALMRAREKQRELRRPRRAARRRRRRRLVFFLRVPFPFSVLARGRVRVREHRRHRSLHARVA
mmetsp:Transcript_235/g.748  ORF Transcript_235/g.748 Transcript_235/m.748 type:complete len:365 (+) Transcript_235:722-1816(+)